MNDPANEVASALYIALGHAAGGRQLIDQANAILADAVASGAVYTPAARQAILALIAATKRAA